MKPLFEARLDESRLGQQGWLAGLPGGHGYRTSWLGFVVIVAHGGVHRDRRRPVIVPVGPLSEALSEPSQRPLFGHLNMN